MNKSDFSIARIGDRVYSFRGPECEVGGTNGVIKDIAMNKDYLWPLYIEFDNDRFERYDKGGYNADTDSFPSLFWSRPHIEIPPPPRRTKWVEVEVRPWITESGKRLLLTDFMVHGKQWLGPLQTIKVEVYDE